MYVLRLSVLLTANRTVYRIIRGNRLAQESLNLCIYCWYGNVHCAFLFSVYTRRVSPDEYMFKNENWYSYVIERGPRVWIHKKQIILNSVYIMICSFFPNGSKYRLQFLKNPIEIRTLYTKCNDLAQQFRFHEFYY